MVVQVLDGCKGDKIHCKKAPHPLCQAGDVDFRTRILVDISSAQTDWPTIQHLSGTLHASVLITANKALSCAVACAGMGEHVVANLLYTHAHLSHRHDLIPKTKLARATSTKIGYRT
jgi:hypothetical protein